MLESIDSDSCYDCFHYKHNLVSTYINLYIGTRYLHCTPQACTDFSNSNATQQSLFLFFSLFMYVTPFSNSKMPDSHYSKFIYLFNQSSSVYSIAPCCLCPFLLSPREAFFSPPRLQRPKTDHYINLFYAFSDTWIDVILLSLMLPLWMSSSLHLGSKTQVGPSFCPSKILHSHSWGTNFLSWTDFQGAVLTSFICPHLTVGGSTYH